MEFNILAQRVKAATAFSIIAIILAIIGWAMTGATSQVLFFVNTVEVGSGSELDLIEGENVTITATSSGSLITYTISATGVSGGGNGELQDLFETISPQFGDSITAGAPDSILNLASSDSTITITGNTASFTIDFLVNQALLNFYHTVQNSGSSLTQRRFLNFTGAAITCIDDNPVTLCTVTHDGTGYDTIQDEGSSLTQRSILNFIGDTVTCVDNAATGRTDCTFTGGGGAGDVFKTIAVPSGTNPVASGSDDTLTLVSGDSTITITGNSTSNLVDFVVNQELLEFYSTIQVSGSALEKRRILNFLGSLTSCVDNPSESSTDCTIAPTGAGVEVPIIETVRKTTDEVVNNSSVLQNDDELLFLLPENSVWAVALVFIYDTNGTPAIKVAFDCPAGSDFVVSRTDIVAVHASCGEEIATGGAGTGDANIIEVQYYGVITTTNSGTLQLQWAQNTANVSDTTVHSGSYLMLSRLDESRTIGGIGGSDHAFTHAESGSDPLFSQHGLGLGQTGEISITSDVDDIRVPIHANFTIKDVVCRVRVAPTGSSIIVDVFKNGTSIFSVTPANRPEIANGALVGTSGVPDTTGLVSSDFFNIDIIQVGSTTPGTDLTCVTRMRQALYDSD